MIDTLKKAKEQLRENWNKGIECPCCGQLVKLYKRKLTSSMAYGLIILSKCDKDKWIHIENHFKELDVPSSIRGDISKLVYWKFLERKIGERNDGSKRIGYYRITNLGRQFVNNTLKAPQHVFIYNNKFQGFSDNRIYITQALGDRFDYNELMNL